MFIDYRNKRKKFFLAENKNSIIKQDYDRIQIENRLWI